MDLDGSDDCIILQYVSVLLHYITYDTKEKYSYLRFD